MTAGNTAAVESGAAPSPAPTGSHPAPASPAVASIAELEAAFPKAGDRFYVDCAKAGCTMAQATERYRQLVDTRLEQANAENERLKAAAKQPGVTPLRSAPASVIEPDAGNAIEQFNAKVKERMAGGLSREKAVIAVTKKHRDLHTAYLAATQKTAAQRRMVADRADALSTVR